MGLLLKTFNSIFPKVYKNGLRTSVHEFPYDFFLFDITNTNKG